MFSVATVLHELLDGKQLFTGANVVEIGSGVLSAPIPAPKGISQSLARVLERAHQRTADARFQSAAEFADALRAVADDNGGEASEHDVRTFVAQVMTAPRRAPPLKSPDLAFSKTPPSGPNQVRAPIDSGNRAVDTLTAPPVNVSVDPQSSKPVSTPPGVENAATAQANVNALTTPPSAPPSRAIYALVFLLLCAAAGAVALFTLRH